MIIRDIISNSIKGMANEILKLLGNTSRPHYQGGKNFYFDGWYGLGTSAVFATIAESVRSGGSNFDLVIHVDCSLWESTREMQRKIAEELMLDRCAMTLFNQQDEVDDFKGVHKSSRAEITAVAELIYKRVMGSRFLMIFHNGSEDDIDLAASGIPLFDWRSTVLWTFRGRFQLYRVINKVKSAYVFLAAYPVANNEREVMASLVHDESAQVIQDINPTVITDCVLYLLHLYFQHGHLVDFDRDRHAANYWVCDGIISGDNAWGISNRLHETIGFKYLSIFAVDMYNTWFRHLHDFHVKVSQWISISSKIGHKNDIQIVPKETTSYFLTLEKSDHLAPLPTHLFEQASKLRVLRLSCCAFSFAFPPFICCSNLRFIFIDNCRDGDVELAGEGDDKQEKEWEFLQRLWVLDIRHTSWDWILSPLKMVLMTQLRELNLKSAGASRWVSGMATLQLTWLCNLRKLRVVDSCTFLTAIVQDSFMGMEKLELLDLSGNSDMEVLPNLSAASILKLLIVDGCDGLQHVEPDTLPASLESFSFDGYGAATSWKNSLDIPEKQVRLSARHKQKLPKVSRISLEGCAPLKNVFLRGLPNLQELNLSETSVKALNLEAMQIKQLERLFLIGCENLRRVQCDYTRDSPLKLMYVDTRGKAERWVDGDCHSYSQQEQGFVHVVATDARFLQGFSVFSQNFHVHVCSTVNSRQLPGTKERKICSSDEWSCIPAVGSLFPYVDVLDKVVKEEDKDEDSLMQACIQLQPSDYHIEFAKGGCNWKIDMHITHITVLMGLAQSLHVHDNSSISSANLNYNIHYSLLRWCRVERCPNLHTVFILDEFITSTESFRSLETFWASDLLRVYCIWSRDLTFDFRAAPYGFSQLKHIHLHSCPRLAFVLPWCFPTLASLETIHVTYCGELTQIFPKAKRRDNSDPPTNIRFPRLRNIHLHHLPMLTDICYAKMSAPALETIKLRGCWSLRRLPAIHDGRAQDMPLAVVDCGKDWWDKLKWDGLEVSYRLFTPRHSRYYNKTIPRGSLLR